MRERRKSNEPTTKTTKIRWTHNQNHKKMKPMKQEWRKMKPIVVLWSRKLFWERRAMWVESFACLFVHQYISSDCTVPSNLSSLPEAPVMSEAKGKWSSKKGLSTGVIVAVVIVGLLWNCWYWYRLNIILLSHLIVVLFLHFVLIEVHEQWKILAFLFLLYLF